MLPELKLTCTPGTKDEATDTVIADDVAEDGDAQEELDVIIHVTTCPFVSEELLNVGLFVPTFVPFTCHW